MGFAHAQVCQQFCNELGLHGRATIGMNRQLVWKDGLFVTGVHNQPFGQGGRLPLGHHPADHVAAEDVEDHIEVVVDPLGRPLELGDVPGPDLVGGRGQQLRLCVNRAAEYGPAFADLLLLGKYSIHGPDRTEIPSLIQQDRIDLRGWQIHESLRMEYIQDLPAFGFREGQTGPCPEYDCGLGLDGRLPAAVEGGSGDPECPAQR